MTGHKTIQVLMIGFWAISLVGCGGSDQANSAKSRKAAGAVSQEDAGDQGPSPLLSKGGSPEDTGKPRVNLVASNYVGEGGTTAVTVVRYGEKNSPLTVFYKVGGTATPGTDYVRLSGEMEIPAGRDGADIKLVTLDNGVIKNSSSVTFSLIPNDAYEIIVDTVSTVLIVDKSQKEQN